LPILSVALLGIIVVVVSILWLKMHPVIGLVLGSLIILFLSPNETAVAQRLASGIADVFEKIGLPIVFASVVGGCLLESGSATKIVQSIVGVFGIRRLAPALSVSGFLMAIPVYFDTVFYLLLPLAKAMAKEKPSSYLMSVMAIIVGATMAHSLVPPTPGPLFVANRLGIPIGMMMMGGTVVGGLAAAVGFGYGVWCSRTMSIPFQILDDVSDAKSKLRMPPLWLALLPLLVPMSLIVVAEAFVVKPEKGTMSVLQSICEPTFALFIAALIGIVTLNLMRNRTISQSVVSKSIGDAGIILLLTCAGGGFGFALKELGVGPAIAKMFPGLQSPMGLLLMAFAITAIVRAAQGSATVAMTTTVGIIQPLLESIDIPFHPLYVALAIGCGSKAFPWMNDSGFWQVSTMTGMSTLQTLKTFSVALTLMGFVGFAVVVTGAWLLPLK